jgi:DNA-binding SARP family transcriptional activator
MTLHEGSQQDPAPPDYGRSEVEVAVLGPVEIRGAVEPFRRRAAGELVAYLAFHPRGATNEVWSAALWPDRCPAQSTLHSTVSVARRSLGRASDGSEHLTRRDGRLCLGRSVGTDIERFARSASSADPLQWKEALSMVRGQIFDGLTLSDWTVLEGISAELESMVVATALKAAEEALHRGQGEEAEWMIRRGLRVSPYDERLYRGLLRSIEAKGNCVGLRSTMAELRHLAAAGEGAAIHPETVALYRELARIRLPEAEGDLVRL